MLSPRRQRSRGANGGALRALHFPLRRMRALVGTMLRAWLGSELGLNLACLSRNSTDL